MEKIFSSFDALGKIIENELDFDFSINEKKINSQEDFTQLLMEPFYNKDKIIFYRGERINDPMRTLIPTLLRNRRELFKNGEPVINIDSDFLLDFYKSKGAYFDLFCHVFGKASKYRLYEICAFSQHYLDFSPFIDFTKSLFVALSFALKNRTEFEDDVVIYTVEINDNSNYTKDMVTAECWLNDYKVTVYNSPEDVLKKNIGYVKPSKVRDSIETIEARSKSNSPKARFIDIPTNDLMKYQQGVFLLLTDYSLFYRSYLTKNIRDDFSVTKYVISRAICRDLLTVITNESPWYTYDCLLDVKRAVSRATEADNNYRILQQNDSII